MSITKFWKQKEKTEMQQLWKKIDPSTFWLTISGYWFTTTWILKTAQ